MDIFSEHNKQRRSRSSNSIQTFKDSKLRGKRSLHKSRSLNNLYFLVRQPSILTKSERTEKMSLGRYRRTNESKTYKSSPQQQWHTHARHHADFYHPTETKVKKRVPNIPSFSTLSTYRTDPDITSIGNKSPAEKVIGDGVGGGEKSDGGKVVSFHFMGVQMETTFTPSAPPEQILDRSTSRSLIEFIIEEVLDTEQEDPTRNSQSQRSKNSTNHDFPVSNQNKSSLKTSPNLGMQNMGTNWINGSLLVSKNRPLLPSFDLPLAVPKRSPSSVRNTELLYDFSGMAEPGLPVTSVSGSVPVSPRSELTGGNTEKWANFSLSESEIMEETTVDTMVSVPTTTTSATIETSASTLMSVATATSVTTTVATATTSETIPTFSERPSATIESSASTLTSVATATSVTTIPVTVVTPATSETVQRVVERSEIKRKISDILHPLLRASSLVPMSRFDERRRKLISKLPNRLNVDLDPSLETIVDALNHARATVSLEKQLKALEQLIIFGTKYNDLKNQLDLSMVINFIVPVLVQPNIPPFLARYISFTIFLFAEHDDNGAVLPVLNVLVLRLMVLWRSDDKKVSEGAGDAILALVKKHAQHLPLVLRELLSHDETIRQQAITAVKRVGILYSLKPPKMMVERKSESEEFEFFGKAELGIYAESEPKPPPEPKPEPRQELQPEPPPPRPQTRETLLETSFTEPPLEPKWKSPRQTIGGQGQEEPSTGVLIGLGLSRQVRYSLVGEQVPENISGIVPPDGKTGNTYPVKWQLSHSKNLLRFNSQPQLQKKKIRNHGKKQEHIRVHSLGDTPSPSAVSSTYSRSPSSPSPSPFLGGTSGLLSERFLQAQAKAQAQAQVEAEAGQKEDEHQVEEEPQVEVEAEQKEDEQQGEEDLKEVEQVEETQKRGRSLDNLQYYECLSQSEFGEEELLEWPDQYEEFQGQRELPIELRQVWEQDKDQDQDKDQAQDQDHDLGLDQDRKWSKSHPECQIKKNSPSHLEYNYWHTRRHRHSNSQPERPSKFQKPRQYQQSRSQSQSQSRSQVNTTHPGTEETTTTPKKKAHSPSLNHLSVSQPVYRGQRKHPKSRSYDQSSGGVSPFIIKSSRTPQTVLRSLRPDPATLWLSLLLDLQPHTILDCPAENLFWLLPILLTQLQFRQDQEHLWCALLHRLNKHPYAGMSFYWLGCLSDLFEPTTKLGITIFGMCHQLMRLQTFLLNLECNWGRFMVGSKFSELDLLDPFGEDRVVEDVVVEVQVVKVFESKARPLLLELVRRDGTKTNAMVKMGDDLRQDWYIQSIFHVFNNIWMQSDLPLKPFIYTYKCIPISETFGCIEFVKNVQSSSDFSNTNIHSMSREERRTFFATLAGSFLASYVLGIRDRHQDNMLVKDGHIFFHIDFGHLWNQGPLLDAPRIAMPRSIVKQFSRSEWKRFVSLCADGFLVLRRNGPFLKSLCATLFSQVTSAEVVAEFLSGNDSLMLQMVDEQARERFRAVFEKSCSALNFKRKFKNFAHGWGRNPTVWTRMVEKDGGGRDNETMEEE